MADGRKRSRAKQARRNARRDKTRRREAAAAEDTAVADAEETSLIEEVRQALDGGQLVELLGLVSMLILATSPRPFAALKPDADGPPKLDELVDAFIDVPIPETTALLTVLGELIVDDDAQRARCRQQVDARKDSLPPWLAELAQTTVRRVVRMSHVLGDGDELLLAVRFADDQELTCAVYIDHLTMSVIKDAFLIPDCIDAVLATAEASNADPDTSFRDVGLADARAELQKSLDGPLADVLLEESDTWPGCRALLRWLIQLMPDAGSAVPPLRNDSARTEELMESFFASLVGAQYKRDHSEVLEACIEAGTGDPLRWSAARLQQLLGRADVEENYGSVEALLEVPELLRAFVPFAHAHSGIRPELTAEALAAIDELADHYRVQVLEELRYRGDLDDDDDPF